MIWTSAVKCPGWATEETLTPNKTCKRCRKNEKREQTRLIEWDDGEAWKKGNSNYDPVWLKVKRKLQNPACTDIATPCRKKFHFICLGLAEVLHKDDLVSKEKVLPLTPEVCWMWHRHYHVFTYIYSLLIEKDICDHWNISFKFPCVCVWLS